MKEQHKDRSLVTVGYILAIMPILILPIVFIPLALLVALVNVDRGAGVHGLIQAVLALALGTSGAMIGGWGFGLPRLILF